MRSAFWLSSGQSKYDASRSKFVQDTELGLGSAPSWSVVKTVQTRIKVGERDHHITNKTNQNQTWVRNSYMPPPPPIPKQQQKTNKKYTQETTTTHTKKQNPKTTHKTKTINQKATTTTKTGQNNSKETTQIYTHTKPNKSNNK